MRRGGPNPVFNSLRSAHQADFTHSSGEAGHGRVYTLARTDGTEQLLFAMDHEDMPEALPAVFETKVLVDSVQKVEKQTGGGVRVELTEQAGATRATYVLTPIVPTDAAPSLRIQRL